LPKLVSTRLTDAQVRSLGPGLWNDGAGLYLQVTPNARSWVFRFQLDGKRRDMGLGPYPTRSLSAARAKAAKAKLMVLDGRDPIEERKAGRVVEAPAPTFEWCCARYVAKARGEWVGRHETNWVRSMEADVFPTLGKLPVDTIDDAAVLRVLEPIWDTKRDTASRIRGRIESVLNWAKAAGHRTGENPACLERSFRSTLGQAEQGRSLRSGTLRRRAEDHGRACEGR
jgi:hypothetical protein